MKKLFYLFALGVILLPACSADIDLDIPDNENIKINADVEIDEADQIQPEDELITYTDSTLGISFNYPKEWGTIEVSQDEIGPKTGYGLSFSESSLFLNAGDVFPDADRGGSWLDILSSQELTSETITSYCQEVTIEASEACEVYSNDNGVQVLKHTFSTYDQAPEDIYAFFNPNDSEFPGVVLGTSGLIDGSPSTQAQKVQFAVLIDSLELQ